MERIFSDETIKKFEEFSEKEFNKEEKEKFNRNHVIKVIVLSIEFAFLAVNLGLYYKVFVS
ncbi:hypothetical protein [Lysinibacillus sphaericus]|uniref:hypothetical protein n=1 Tax=Lysinibacillus sphaericus TaxID=1421 RepID=UPI000C1A2C2D|nr:hypothetical protein [Lysinibacillus sphaericus]PIJ95823.1 hypothetical protein CTN02_21925 [Lysinibacillus sphaericus]